MSATLMNCAAFGRPAGGARPPAKAMNLGPVPGSQWMLWVPYRHRTRCTRIRLTQSVMSVAESERMRMRDRPGGRLQTRPPPLSSPWPVRSGGMNQSISAIPTTFDFVIVIALKLVEPQLPAVNSYPSPGGVQRRRGTASRRSNRPGQAVRRSSNCSATVRVKRGRARLGRAGCSTSVPERNEQRSLGGRQPASGRRR
jgi:hypothetical protein